MPNGGIYTGTVTDIIIVKLFIYKINCYIFRIKNIVPAAILSIGLTITEVQPKQIEKYTWFATYSK